MNHQVGQDGLDLISYLDNALGHHCPLCFFLDIDIQNTECPHRPTQQTSKDVTKVPFNSSSSSKPLPQLPTYATSTTSSTGFSFTKSVDTVIARVSVSDSYTSSSSSEGTQRGLRRKSLPNGTNLRELNVRHSDESLLKPLPQPKVCQSEGGLRFRDAQQRLLRVQQSDERLRRLYEEQMLSYLESPLAEFDPFSE